METRIETCGACRRFRALTPEQAREFGVGRGACYHGAPWPIPAFELEAVEPGAGYALFDVARPLVNADDLACADFAPAPVAAVVQASKAA